MSNRLNRFLIVDRAEAPSRQFSRIGRRLGYRTDTADTLEEFVAALAGQAPTAVLIDLQSVDDDCLGHLKALRDHADDALLILTGDGSPRRLETAKQLAEFLGLPVVASPRSSMIVNVVRRELQKARQSQTEMTAGDLRAALAAGNVRPHYLPRASYRPRHGWPITEVEAVARCRGNGAAVIMPDDFLVLADDAGLLPDIAERLLEQVVVQLKDWRSRRINLSVSINLPAATLGDRALPAYLGKLLKEARLDPGLLTLGAGESLAMSYSTAVVEVLCGLKDLGCRLAVDEFGSGYSSLEQLRRLRFDELKVDPSLVGECRVSGDARAILEATVALADKLGLSVCADGVESQRTLQYVGRVGCRKAQGNYFSRPLTAAALEARLMEWNVPAKMSAVAG